MKTRQHDETKTEVDHQHQQQHQQQQNKDVYQRHLPNYPLYTEALTVKFVDNAIDKLGETGVMFKSPEPPNLKATTSTRHPVKFNTHRNTKFRFKLNDPNSFAFKSRHVKDFSEISDTNKKYVTLAAYSIAKVADVRFEDATLDPGRSADIVIGQSMHVENALAWVKTLTFLPYKPAECVTYPFGNTTGYPCYQEITSQEMALSVAPQDLESVRQSQITSTYSIFVHEWLHYLFLFHPEDFMAYVATLSEEALATIKPDLEEVVLHQTFSIMADYRNKPLKNYNTNLLFMPPEFSPIILSLSENDIKALHMLYGENKEFGRGKDTYDLALRANEGMAIIANEKSDFIQNNITLQTFETIWDPKGPNTFSAEHVTGNAYINLNPTPYHLTYIEMKNHHHFIAQSGTSADNAILSPNFNSVYLNENANIVVNNGRTVISTFVFNSNHDVVFNFKQDDAIIFEYPVNATMDDMNFEINGRIDYNMTSYGFTRYGNKIDELNHQGLLQGVEVKFNENNSIFLANHYTHFTYVIEIVDEDTKLGRLLLHPENTSNFNMTSQQRCPNRNYKAKLAELNMRDQQIHSLYVSFASREMIYASVCTVGQSVAMAGMNAMIENIGSSQNLNLSPTKKYIFSEAFSCFVTCYVRDISSPTQALLNSSIKVFSYYGYKPLLNHSQAMHMSAAIGLAAHAVTNTNTSLAYHLVVNELIMMGLQYMHTLANEPDVKKEIVLTPTKENAMVGPGQRNSLEAERVNKRISKKATKRIAAKAKENADENKSPEINLSTIVSMISATAIVAQSVINQETTLQEGAIFTATLVSSAATGYFVNKFGLFAKGSRFDKMVNHAVEFVKDKIDYIVPG